MTTNKEQNAAPSEATATTWASPEPIGAAGSIVEDLLVTFETDRGDLTDGVRAEIARWAESWVAKYPGAVVVMGCNGKSRNGTQHTREVRLKMLSAALGEFGVFEDRIRYTDDVIDVSCAGSPISPERGVACIKVFRSAVIEAAVIPISDLFRGAESTER